MVGQTLDCELGPLVTVRDALGPGEPPTLAAYGPEAQQALRKMARYVAEFLTASHPQLGRPGAVCPFARSAVDHDLVRLTACAVAGEGADEEALVIQSMEGLLQTVAAQQEERLSPLAVVAVFPRLSEPGGARMIERIQRSLKLSFVQRRLMIGQFYPSCPEPGLWSADFRPLQSPVISLAVRTMNISDAPFMLDQQEYVDAYVRAFGEPGSDRIAKARREKAAAVSGCPAEARA